MSDEEEDYMSEEILNACSKNDVRPGLAFQHSQKRKFELDKRKVEKNYENQTRYPKKGRLEAERREEGLEQPISQENKGFAMLQKMGYKPGSAIGRVGSSGLKEPVAVVVKSDRGGLGREAALLEIEKLKLEKLKQRAKRLDNLSDYRSQLSSKFNFKADKRDLRLSQITCENLDAKNQVESPPYPWFWREVKKEEEEVEEEEQEEKAEEEEEQLEPEEQLEMLTLYLRRTYFYCIWCGTQFENDEDLEKECPGSTRNDH